jgi:glutaredoxin
MLEFYGYKKCGTSRKAQKWLDSNGVDHRFIDITENPPPKALLQRIVKSGHYELKQLFNRSGGEYRALADEHPGRRRILVSRVETARTTEDGIEIVPWREFCVELWAGRVVSSIPSF